VLDPLSAADVAAVSLIFFFSPPLFVFYATLHPHGADGCDQARHLAHFIFPHSRPALLAFAEVGVRVWII